MMARRVMPSEAGPSKSAPQSPGPRWCIAPTIAPTASRPSPPQTPQMPHISFSSSAPRARLAPCGGGGHSTTRLDAVAPAGDLKPLKPARAQGGLDLLGRAQVLVVVGQRVVRVEHGPLREQLLAELRVAVVVVDERRVLEQRRAQTPQAARVLPRQAVQRQQRAGQAERERLGDARGPTYEQPPQVALKEVARVLG